MNPYMWPRRFYDYGWAELVQRFHEFADLDPRMGYLADVVDSVISNRAADRLAGHNSLYSLIVTTQPVPPGPPTELITVRPSRRGPVGETVWVEYDSITGEHERITGPSSDAVPLFWRFLSEKLGVVPMRPPPPTEA